MKKFYFAILAFCCWHVMSGQGIAIPDLDFKTKLLSADADNEIAEIQQQLAATPNFQNEANSHSSIVPGIKYHIVRSKTAFDSNKNGCSTGDPSVPFIGYKVTQGTTDTIYLSGRNGEYDLPLRTGNSTVVPFITNSSYFDISPSSASFAFSAQSNPQEQRFCVTAKGDYPDLEISILPLDSAVPGYAASYKILYRNKGTVTQSGTVGLQFNASVLHLDAVSPEMTSESPGRLLWAFSDLMPFQSRSIILNLVLNTPADSPALNTGDILSYTASINSSARDVAPEDNTASMRQTVTNSFDPNDKVCIQGETVSSGVIGQYVNYIVRFENIGTAIAKNIVVKDIIDTNSFDIASLLPIEGSHAFTTKISNGNTVEFVFKDIDLPFYDNINDGYIAFKIKTKPTLAVGDAFRNSASIYFDFNLPIITDSAVTTITSLETPEVDFANRFSVYPNPSKGLLHIDPKENIQMKSVSIYNMMGQRVLVSSPAYDAKTVDVSDLASGNYVIKIYSDEGYATGRFMKE